MKGDKIVAFCDRNCNIIAPFVTAAGNRNESPLFREAFGPLKTIAKTTGFNISERKCNIVRDFFIIVIYSLVQPDI